LTPQDFADGANCAELKDSAVVARKELTGRMRALQGVWAAGLNEFPSMPMQRAKVARQSPAAE
jgi:hypothetical protein